MESKQVVKNNENGKQKYIAKLVGFSRPSFSMTQKIFAKRNKRPSLVAHKKIEMKTKKGEEKANNE